MGWGALVFCCLGGWRHTSEGACCGGVSVRLGSVERHSGCSLGLVFWEGGAVIADGGAGAEAAWSRVWSVCWSRC